MRGVVFLGDRELELQEFPDPTPGPGEVVVEIKASGMCGSDLKFYRAAKDGGTAALGLGGDGSPVIAGHEPCGVVAAVGPGVDEPEAAIGSRIMVHHYAGCGHCEHCRVGWSQLCGDGITVYGVTGHDGHAPYIKVPAWARPGARCAGSTSQDPTPSPFSARARWARAPPSSPSPWARG